MTEIVIQLTSEQQRRDQEFEAKLGPERAARIRRYARRAAEAAASNVLDAYYETYLCLGAEARS